MSARTTDEDFLLKINDEPILDQDLSDYTFTDMIYCKNQISYVLTVGTHKQTKETAVTKYFHVALCRALGRQCAYDGVLPMEVGRAAVSVSVFHSKGIRLISRAMACIPKISLCDTDGSINISLVLALLRWIPGMAQLPLSYYMKLDEGVDMTTGGDELALDLCRKYIPDFVVPQTAGDLKVYYMHTTETMTCLAYAVLLMTVKTINLAAAGQMDIFLENRIRALCHTLGLPAKSISWNITLKPILEVSELMKLNSELSFFPCLRKTMFIPVIDQYTPALQHMNSIFQESSMTIFSLIAEFWLTTDVSRLHVSPTVLVELPVWQETMSSLIKIYGSSWRFYKLIDPKGTLTAVSHFRTLGCAALSWKKQNSAQTGQMSLNQLQGVKSNPEFEKLATQKLKPEFIGRDAKSYIEIVKGLLESKSTFISINWERVLKAIETGEWVSGVDF